MLSTPASKSRMFSLSATPSEKKANVSSPPPPAPLADLKPTGKTEAEPEPERAPGDKAAKRICRRCRTAFLSEG